MPREGLVPAKGEFAGPEILLILAGQISMAGSELIETLAPGKPGYRHIKDPWVGFSHLDHFSLGSCFTGSS